MAEQEMVESKENPKFGTLPIFGRWERVMDPLPVIASSVGTADGEWYEARIMFSVDLARWHAMLAHNWIIIHVGEYEEFDEAKHGLLRALKTAIKLRERC